jgi:hypothetical protein
MKKCLWPLVFALLLAACATAPSRPHPMLQAQLAALKIKLFELVEAEREQAGARPLVLDPERMGAAQAHSDDMAKKRSFDTMNPNGNLAQHAASTVPVHRLCRKQRGAVFHAVIGMILMQWRKAS